MLAMTLLLLAQHDVKAQCQPGEVELSLEIHTDSYGYEGYWEIVPGGNNCGNGTLLSGGNTAVGCNGGGARIVNSGGYGNNQIIQSTTICVADSGLFELEYRDDWGDGGFEFYVKINGYIVDHFEGSGASNSFVITAIEPLQFEASLEDIDKPYGYVQPGSHNIEIHMFNAGRDTISSLDISYQVNNDPVISNNIGGLSISNYDEDHISLPGSWQPINNGTYDIKVWIDQINGNLDMNPINDTLSKTIEVGSGTPNIIDTYLSSGTRADMIGSAVNQLNGPTDLDFHPTLSANELWVINKRNENSGGSTVTFYDAGTSSQYSQHKVDGNSWHFMSLPTGIAFSENTNFANSPGVFDANHNGGQPFTGPALWSSDPNIYAKPSGGNGSHLDMLHQSPECQGIAHEVDNVFWVFDGYNNDIVRYDFAADHGPGNADHSDGIVWRYSQSNVSKDAQNKVVSHLVYDKPTDWLYVVDNDNKRVIRLDAKTGTKGSTPGFGPFEPLAEYVHIVNYTWETVVDSGLIEPAGIDIIENRMIVSDYATGDIIFYDISSMPAVEMHRINTGAFGIMGVKIGPEGKIWYVDYDGNTVHKLDFSAVGIAENLESDIQIYPNPGSGYFNIHGLENADVEVSVYTAGGVLVQSLGQVKSNERIELDLPEGFYLVELNDLSSHTSTTRSLIIKN